MLFLILLFCISVSSQNKSERIIGGGPAPEGRAPYLVSIMDNLKHFCGGSLITTRSVLSAAHCTENRNGGTYAVRAGSNYRTQGGIIVGVTRWKVHPKFNSQTIAYDLAFFYLDDNLTLNSRIQTIPLFNGRLRRQKAIIVGWGSVREGGNPTNYLQITAIRVISRQTCRRDYRRALRETMFCAGTRNARKDSCQGDSGGPLVIQGTLAGIISVGNGCARRGYPGLYTRLPKLKNWVRQNRIN